MIRYLAAGMFVFTAVLPAPPVSPGGEAALPRRLVVVVLDEDPPEGCRCSNNAVAAGMTRDNFKSCPNTSTIIWQLDVDITRRPGACKKPAVQGCDADKLCVTTAVATLQVFQAGLACDNVAGNGYWLNGSGVGTPDFTDPQHDGSVTVTNQQACNGTSAASRIQVQAPDGPGGGPGNESGRYEFATRCGVCPIEPV